MKKDFENLLVLTGFRCNNNCIVCSIAGRERDYRDRDLSEVLADLKEGAQNGCKSVEFTGGEPSIRKDIINLVSEAKKLGYTTISLSTNGRLFSYGEFCEKIVNAGLNKVTFSLLGPSKQIHDSVTRTPGTFDQILAGIRNMQKYDNVHINISTVISRLNYKNLKEFGNFIASVGINNWYLLDLIPDGNSRTHYSRLVVRLKDLYNELNTLNDISGKFNEFGFFDFPLCLFKPELLKKKNAIFINAKMRDETTKQVGYQPERITCNSEGKYFDAYRMNIDVCKKCRHYKECGGIWKEYLDIFGEGEINDLNK